MGGLLRGPQERKGGGVMYAVGEYEATVTGQALTTTKNGNPQIEVICSLKGTSDENGNPVIRTVFMPLTAKTVEFVAADLERVFGFCPEKWSQLSPDSPSFVKLMGDVVLYCKHEEYEGRPKERWSFSDPTRGGGRKAPEANQLMALDAMFGAALAGRKRPPTNGAKKPAAAPTHDDEIPF